MELMITVALIGITAAIAVPNFKSFIDNNKVKKAAMQLQSGLMYARSEAVKRNSTIYLKPDSDSSSGWVDGWSVTTVDKTHDACLSDAENCLKIIPAISGISVNSAATEIEYNKQGRTSSAAFEFCDNDNKAIKLTVSISSTGAPSIKQDGACP